VLIVAAAGNENVSTPFYPAAFPDVIAVAATDENDQRGTFSNFDANWVDIAAPGVDILSTLPTYANATGSTGYGYMSGTSMAAPFVSGVAALIWPTVAATSTPGVVKRAVAARLCDTADAIAGTGAGQYWSCGLLNACQAVLGGPSPTCSPTNTPPTTPAPVTPPTTPPVVAPVPVAPAPVLPPASGLPLLTKALAHQHLHTLLREALEERFGQRRGYQRRCARNSNTRFACAISWSHRNSYYYGSATIYNDIYKESVAWYDNATIHWTNTRCRHTPAPIKRSCKIHTIHV
jgi:hypothetical protein